MKPSEALFEMWLSMVQDILHADQRTEAARVPQNARQQQSSSSASSRPNQQSSSSAAIQPHQSSSSAPSRPVGAKRPRKRKIPPIDGAKIMKSLLKNLNRWNRSKFLMFRRNFLQKEKHIRLLVEILCVFW